jgi:hypothetical protein
METQNTNKRTLADHAHYYISARSEPVADGPKKDQLEQGSVRSKSTTIFCLGHCTIEGVDPLRSLVLLTPFYRKEFDQILIITSSFNENTARAHLPRLGFSQDPQGNGHTYWNLQRSTAVAIIQENYLLEALLALQAEDTHAARQGRDVALSRLIVVDASGFGITFLDKLCGSLQGVMVISGKTMSEAIESYQVIKAYSQLKGDLAFDYFFVANTDDTAGPIVRDKICYLTERFLKKRIRVTSLFPGDFFTSFDINDVNMSVCFKNLTLLKDGLAGNGLGERFFTKIEEYINGNAMIL